MKKIYISAPITGTTDYMERFTEAEEALTREGWTVINPARVNAQLPADTTHEEYMRMSLCMLSMCDAMIMLRGWNGSKGCKMEMDFAAGNGITIIREIDEVTP